MRKSLRSTGPRRSLRGAGQDRLGQASGLLGGAVRAERLARREQAFQDQHEPVGQLGRTADPELADQLAEALADPRLARDRVAVRGQVGVGKLGQRE